MKCCEKFFKMCMGKKDNGKVKESKESVCKCGCFCGHGHKGHIMYGMGFLGALMYYMSTATGAWGYIAGFFKAIFWPAFLIKAILKFFGA